MSSTADSDDMLEGHVLSQVCLTSDNQRLPMSVRNIDPRPDAWRGEQSSPSLFPLPSVVSLQNRDSLSVTQCGRSSDLAS